MDAIFIVVAVGFLACVTAVVAGLVVAFDKVVVECHDGQSFPNGTTDFNCYSYPQAGMGIGIIAVGIGLGAVLILLRVVHEALTHSATSAQPTS